ncbi:helix-turn-helix domain-containing protein [Candidatus Izemoplasma sp. B36]|uniref:helix-turn-helix domain-containing protein n=1 Tax=Candidatus Izemoplasma sp. B36 TaxID=3242468 RepID=UPI0035583916
MNNENVGKFLQNLRQRNNLTQANIAEICNVTHQAVSQWENGKSFPDIDSLKSLSNLYNISINDIIDCKEQERESYSFDNNINNELLPKEVINSLTISIIIASLSLLLVFVGLIGRTLQLMILPALFICLYHIIDLYMLKKRKEKITNSYLNKIKILKIITIIFLAISLIIFIGFLGSGDLLLYGYIQPFIYAGMILNYQLNYKNIIL